MPLIIMLLLFVSISLHLLFEYTFFFPEKSVYSRPNVARNLHYIGLDLVTTVV